MYSGLLFNILNISSIVFLSFSEEKRIVNKFYPKCVLGYLDFELAFDFEQYNL